MDASAISIGYMTHAQIYAYIHYIYIFIFTWVRAELSTLDWIERERETERHNEQFRADG